MATANTVTRTVATQRPHTDTADTGLAIGPAVTPTTGRDTGTADITTQATMIIMPRVCITMEATFNFNRGTITSIAPDIGTTEQVSPSA